MRSPIDAMSAASACISPSTISSGAFSLTALVAACTFSTSGCAALPLVENDSIATRGSTPATAWKLRAELMAMSAS